MVLNKIIYRLVLLRIFKNMHTITDTIVNMENPIKVKYLYPREFVKCCRGDEIGVKLQKKNFLLQTTLIYLFCLSGTHVRSHLG